MDKTIDICNPLQISVTCYGIIIIINNHNNCNKKKSSNLEPDTKGEISVGRREFVTEFI